ncbi:MAG: hypothetical protein FWF69_10225 [Firmicutes bacterium]|nr:hypothetical protein [Bacillota bacterium]
MLKISIGILLVCVLLVGANALRAALQALVPWVDETLLAKWRGAGIKRNFLWVKRTASLIRGPNGLWGRTGTRPGTGRRWLEADTLILP